MSLRAVSSVPNEEGQRCHATAVSRSKIRSPRHKNHGAEDLQSPPSHKDLPFMHDTLFISEPFKEFQYKRTIWPSAIYHCMTDFQHKALHNTERSHGSWDLINQSERDGARESADCNPLLTASRGAVNQ